MDVKNYIELANLAEQVADGLRLSQILLPCFNVSVNPTFITNREGEILWVNLAFTQHFGYGPEEVLGKTPRVLKSGNHTSAYYKHLWETILSGQVWKGDLQNRRKDGSLTTDFTVITPVTSGETVLYHVAVKQIAR